MVNSEMKNNKEVVVNQNTGAISKNKNIKMTLVRFLQKNVKTWNSCNVKN